MDIGPGGVYGNVTPENFGRPGIVDYRNPNIAATMKIFGIIQAFGRGIAITRAEMKKNGNPEPIFSVNSSTVMCSMKARVNHISASITSSEVIKC